MFLTQRPIALTWRLVLLTGLVVATMATRAAGFDCGKANKTAERMICADAVLFGLDDQMAADYREAQRLSLDPGTLRKDQSLWLLDRDACADRTCLVAAYGRRLKSLQDLNRRESRLRSGEYRLESLGQTCLPFAGDPPDGPYDDCKLMDVRSLGLHEAQHWYAAQYCLLQPLFPEARCTTRQVLTDSMDGAILILSQSHPGGPLRVVLRHGVTGGLPGDTVIYRNKAGLILDIPVYLAGTGRFNGSGYFIREGGRWEPIDFKSWQRDLARRLPKGLGVWKGPWPDLRKLSFDSPLWKNRDANCCPTGGSVHADVGLENRRLFIRELSVRREGP